MSGLMPILIDFIYTIGKNLDIYTVFETKFKICIFFENRLEIYIPVKIVDSTSVS